MIRCTAMGGSARHYYTHLHSEDYYLRLDGEPGVWAGKGAERLGLKGDVTEKEFSALFLGYDPQDPARKLVQNAGKMTSYEKDGEISKEGRKPGWDVTMSAPKSLSVLYAMSSESERRWIREQLIEAGKETIGYLEAATVTRTGQGGKVKEKTELVSSIFLHTTARAVGESMPDPQLHLHGTIINVGVSPTEKAKDRDRPKTRSIRSEQFFELQHEADSVFMLSLASRISKRYELTKGVHSWEVRDVPKSLCDAFSKRSQEVEAIAPRGTPAWQREEAALKTRSKKDPKLTRPEIEAAWTREGRAHGFTHEKAASLIQRDGPKEQERKAKLDAGLALAAGGFFAEKQFFTERKFLHHVYRELGREGFGRNEVEVTAKNYLQANAFNVGATKNASFWMRGSASPEQVVRARSFAATLEQDEVEGRRLLLDEMKRLERQGRKVIGVTWSNAERETLERGLRRPPEKLLDHVKQTFLWKEIPINTVSRMLHEIEKKPHLARDIGGNFEHHVTKRAEVLAAKARLATGRGTKAQRARDETIIARSKEYAERYDIAPGALVVVYGPRNGSAKERKLIDAIEKRGGEVKFSEEMMPLLRSEQKARAEGTKPLTRVSDSLKDVYKEAIKEKELRDARREAFLELERERVRFEELTRSPEERKKAREEKDRGKVQEQALRRTRTRE